MKPSHSDNWQKSTTNVTRVTPPQRPNLSINQLSAHPPIQPLLWVAVSMAVLAGPARRGQWFEGGAEPRQVDLFTLPADPLSRL